VHIMGMMLESKVLGSLQVKVETLQRYHLIEFSLSVAIKK